ncbi:MAG TPA: dienelactone hydrolase family protein [Anaerolineae bacterium]
MNNLPPLPSSGRGDDGLRNYIVEEFIEDLQDGRITRRQALKQIAFILGSVTLANSVLAACAPLVQPAPVATAAPTSAPAATGAVTATAAAIATAAATATLTTTATQSVQPPANDVTVGADDPTIDAIGMVKFASGADMISAYAAKPKGSGAYPIVLVCHENRGLTEHIKDVTRRVAKAGYFGVGVDLLSRQGGTDQVGANAPGVLGTLSTQQFVDDFRAALSWAVVQPNARKGKAGMVGFCFGGGVVWACVTQIAELGAGVPFYGANPPIEDVAKIQAAVLGIYGELDTRIDAGIPAIEAAMKQNNKTFEKIIYPNANHAFNNDTGSSYNATAAKDAWAKTLAWFGKYLNN